jgi:hypothetical protein
LSEPLTRFALPAEKKAPADETGGRKMKISSPFEEELFWVARRN